jgi:amidase
VAVDEDARPDFTLHDAFRNFQRLLYGAVCHSMPFAHTWPTRWPWMFTPPTPGDNQVSRALRYGGASHRDWILAHEAREEYRRAWAALFERCDVLLCPVSPVAAIAHNHHFGGAIIFRTMRGSGHRRRYVDQMMWSGMVGQSYLPATVAPVGRTAGGLPVGIQIVGPYLEDRTTIDFARRLGGVCGGFEPPPGF